MSRVRNSFSERVWLSSTRPTPSSVSTPPVAQTRRPPVAHPFSVFTSIVAYGSSPSASTGCSVGINRAASRELGVSLRSKTSTVVLNKRALLLVDAEVFIDESVETNLKFLGPVALLLEPDI